MAALPVTIAVKNIKCRIETDEVGADEPYVLVTAIDLKTFPLPTVEVTRYGPWGDVDKGETHSTMPLQPGFNPDNLPGIVWRRNAWGPSGSAKAIASPQDAIILVSMMEHDDGEPRRRAPSSRAPWCRRSRPQVASAVLRRCRS